MSTRGDDVLRSGSVEVNGSYASRLPFDSLRSLRAIRLRLTLDVLEEWPAMSGAERSEAESNGSRGRTRPEIHCFCQ
jgi:hypothetical protein